MISLLLSKETTCPEASKSEALCDSFRPETGETFLPPSKYMNKYIQDLSAEIAVCTKFKQLSISLLMTVNKKFNCYCRKQTIYTLVF